jgi:hypothetical protein
MTTTTPVAKTSFSALGAMAMAAVMALGVLHSVNNNNNNNNSNSNSSSAAGESDRHLKVTATGRFRNFDSHNNNNNNNNNSNSTNPNNNSNNNVWLAMLSNQVEHITEDTFAFVMDYNCHKQATVPMVVKNGVDALAVTKRRNNHALFVNENANANYFNDFNESDSDSYECAPFHVMVEPAYLEQKLPNRIDRIAHVRDMQRRDIRQLLTRAHGSVEEQEHVDAVIVLDSDLYSVPNPALVAHEMNSLLFPLSPSPSQSEEASENEKASSPAAPAVFDVLCAMGVNHEGSGNDNDKSASAYYQSEDGFGYYDTFGTILEPNTWTYPLEHRLHNKALLPNEDPLLVVKSNDRMSGGGKAVIGGTHTGTMTSQQLLRYIKKRATTLDTTALPVRSCFGGMALYRGDVWLLPQQTQEQQHQQEQYCTYSSEHVGFTGAYANRDDERTCEHITFHQCLKNKAKVKAKLTSDDADGHVEMIKIGLHPYLVTEYHDVRALVSDSDTTQRFLQDDANCICPFDLFVHTDEDGDEVRVKRERENAQTTHVFDEMQRNNQTNLFRVKVHTSSSSLI